MFLVLLLSLRIGSLNLTSKENLWTLNLTLCMLEGHGEKIRSQLNLIKVIDVFIRNRFNLQGSYSVFQCLLRHVSILDAVHCPACPKLLSDINSIGIQINLKMFDSCIFLCCSWSCRDVNNLPLIRYLGGPKSWSLCTCIFPSTSCQWTLLGVYLLC